MLTYYKNATDNFYISYIDDPRESLQAHSHDYYQIVFINRGKLFHHVAGRVIPLYAGDVFILPPGIPHYIENTADRVEFYTLFFMPDYFVPERETNKFMLDFLLYLKLQPWEKVQPRVTLSYADAAFAETLIKRIKTEFDGKAVGKDELIRECLSSLLSLFARVYFEDKSGPVVSENNRQSVAHCIEYINLHFNSKISLSEMARLSATSKTNFCLIFRSMTGVTFKEYLNKIRVEKAAGLISAGERATAAATICGFDDLSTFYRNFKKYKGVSPGRFSGAAK